ncbi:MAG: UDP-N-acetylmuramate--L-alanine ligase [Acidobacteria bacterium]|nr:UDP-N-acetylmuramate--L-alanine ligase [Acidobacteriota bacterium]
MDEPSRPIRNLLFGDLRRFHFVGVGGIGMSSIAHILISEGLQVSGSDIQDSRALEDLRRRGARIFVGHDPLNIEGSQAVVFSSAVPADNPELVAARARGISVLHRADVLAGLMHFRKGVAVAGTHGKTTTTSMIGMLLEEAGLDPTVIVGGTVPLWGGNARHGTGPWLVAEADESDRSFLKLVPFFSVITNIDADHLDTYRDLEDVRSAFEQYLQQLPFYAVVVACADDSNLRPLLKNVHQRVVTYGLGASAEVSAKRIRLESMKSSYDCFFVEELLGHVELNVAGRHNIANSLAAVSVGMLLEIPFPVIQSALKRFEGVGRRMEKKGERDGVWVIDDYGHHPAEIRATLEACRQIGKRLLVVFQPHRYTRTLYLMEELANCFEGADAMYLMDVYPAGEKPIPGAGGDELARKIRQRRQVLFCNDAEMLVKELQREARPGDLLLTLGAGDVWRIGELFLAKRQ